MTWSASIESGSAGLHFLRARSFPKTTGRSRWVKPSTSFISGSALILTFADFVFLKHDFFVEQDLADDVGHQVQTIEIVLGLIVVPGALFVVSALLGVVARSRLIVVALRQKCR